MKKILLMSDTHNHLDKKMIYYVKWADEVWHAGDVGQIKIIDELSKIKPLRAVYGNIDGNLLRSQLNENLLFNCEGVKVLITHIGGYPGKYNLKAKKIILAEKPKIFICGHSHILRVNFDKKLNLIYINPGAAGVKGFHNIRTMVRFVIDRKEIKNLEIIELGPRGKIISTDQRTL
ncbi:MAG: YfcE family phosphodiesterase [Flavobacteriales bacterium]|nr:YfcE family phosphodiesterase [Flavobacteriales bacterium]